MSEYNLRSAASYVGLILMMAATSILAVLLIGPVKAAGLGAFEDPGSILNAFLFIFAMLVVTAILLILIKWKAQQVISIIIGFSLAAVIYYVVMALFQQLGIGLWADVIGVICAIVIIALLWFYPEWYVINAAGIIVASGCAAIFGVSLSLIPVLILLVLLMIYDYIAVKRSKHMLTLADGVLRQKMPIMFLVPKTKGYSYRKSGFSIRDEKGERGAYMIGMGDMIMPAILVVSAQVFAGGVGVLSVFGLYLPAFGALIGGIIGLLILMVPVNTGKPQPGLPLINGCAILGFFIFCLITGSWNWLIL
ncbi:MAG TPA: presenilin family intramembrane aspartyl protease PSH [Methanocorpusculum sp.]|nr:presenilin family intramembrane aspartyl protease PSH [Methanocorpusculum sp.]